MFKLGFASIVFGGLMGESIDWREYARKRLEELMAQRRFAIRKRGLDWAKSPKHLILMKIIYEVGEILDGHGITGPQRVNYYNVARSVFKRAWLMGLDKIDEAYAYVRATKDWINNCDREIMDKVVEIVKAELSANLEQAT